jgi:hypothetical protein
MAVPMRTAKTTIAHQRKRWHLGPWTTDHGMMTIRAGYRSRICEDQGLQEFSTNFDATG